MAGTILGLNPIKKFPEFNGYAVFMNEQLEGMMDEDSLTARSAGCASVLPVSRLQQRLLTIA